MRPKRVLDHILKHGSVNTEELKELYGYNHPPRAAGDVKDAGIPLVMTRVMGKGGRKIAAYKLGDPNDIKNGQFGGRRAFSKDFKAALIAHYGEKCTITGERWAARYLQIDHRIPYEVAGEMADESVESFMLLDASLQRAKSFSCENCPNRTLRDVAICSTCFWAFPENYSHVATIHRRQVMLSFQGEAEMAQYENLKAGATSLGVPITDYIKAKLS